MMNRAVSLGLLLAGAAIAADDPFADVRPQMAPAATEPAIPWWRDNWQVRRELYGVVAGGWQMGRAALAAQRRLDDGDTDTDFLQGKITTVR
ncbi:MAG TPA: acyl-CoA dehydrogenase C-terminal domain-containing protein, partial [Kiritimatiellia bacterium]|nr:acyl-CoA dehydrogenase C-terminal domain-containing protein [Kiritimatiellia bacterium]